MVRIFANLLKKKLNTKRVQLPQDWFGTPTWPPFHCFGTPIWPPWRHVKTLYRDLELKQWRWRRQRGRQKTNRFRLAKQQLCTCITLFCTFLYRHCTTTAWNFLISPFLENMNTRQRLSFSFPELRYSLLEFNSRKIANIWRIERDGISAIKFDVARIYLSSDVLVGVAVVVP